MRAAFTQDQRDLTVTIEALAASGRASARAAHEGPWVAPACDATLLRDFSVLGVPESAGGVGSGLIDLMVACEVLGRHLVASSFPAHAAAIQLLVGSGVPLEPALTGEQRWTVAVDQASRTGEGREPDARAAWKTLVPLADEADRIAVSDPEGVRLAETVQVQQRVSVDPSMPLADVLPAAGPSAPSADGVARATLVAAAQACGVAQGAIDLGAEYARTRQQFGRVIGSFQGVAFPLVDAVVARKAAWDLTLHAAWALEEGRPDAPMQVHAAKAAAGRAAVFAAERGLQVHGGMGITHEADPHLFLRRAFVLDAWLGSGAGHRRKAGRLRIADRRRSTGGDD